jgi:hypothetical protein
MTPAPEREHGQAKTERLLARRVIEIRPATLAKAKGVKREAHRSIMPGRRGPSNDCRRGPLVFSDLFRWVY